MASISPLLSFVSRDQKPTNSQATTAKSHDDGKWAVKPVAVLLILLIGRYAPVLWQRCRAQTKAAGTGPATQGASL